MKHFTQISLIVIINALLIWLWVICVDPEPSISIFILILVPIVFVTNLVIALFLWLARKKRHSLYFVVNSILSSIVAVFLFGKGVDRNLDRRLDEWEFNHKDSILTISLWTETDSYYMMHKIAPTITTGYDHGTYTKTNKQLILTSLKDSTQIIITSNNELINFKNKRDSIILKRIR